MNRAAFAVSCSFLTLLVTGCPKSVPTSSLPPPPMASDTKPVVNFFAADPTTLVKGQTASLRSSVQNADTIQIDNGLGSVAPNDRHVAQPSGTTTYKLLATKGSETTTALLTITVSLDLYFLWKVDVCSTAGVNDSRWRLWMSCSAATSGNQLFALMI